MFHVKQEMREQVYWPKNKMKEFLVAIFGSNKILAMSGSSSSSSTECDHGHRGKDIIIEGMLKGLSATFHNFTISMRTMTVDYIITSSQCPPTIRGRPTVESVCVTAIKEGRKGQAAGLSVRPSILAISQCHIRINWTEILQLGIPFCANLFVIFPLSPL